MTITAAVYGDTYVFPHRVITSSGFPGVTEQKLWLSTDENPANKQLIAFASEFTYARQWTKYASQQSSPISLVANKTYYIEALHKEATAADHVAVGWQ